MFSLFAIQLECAYLRKDNKTKLSLCPFDLSVGVGAFVIGLSQISSFFSCNLPLNSNVQIFPIILHSD